MLDRLARTTAAVCLALAVGAAMVWPGEWRRAFGVIGGGALLALSWWAIRGAVDAWLGDGESRGDASETGRRGRGPGLVKFFTRYGMLALAAYVMMARLHLDPVGMLAGVSALGLAAGVEVVRSARAPHMNRRS